ncbi:MAG TPA: DUF4230 domain-containing protein [Thermoanaerobaculia bacterium]|nr:DUF4230 domain-containing protein [Thermoanaerobaculia bacterium]
MIRSTFVRVLPWVLVAVLAAAILWLLSRAGLPWGESRNVSAAPVVMAVRRIAQFSTVEVQVSDVVRYEEAMHFLVFDFPKSATLRLRGRVLGGFDLDNRSFRVVPDGDRRVVRVRLPWPRILAVDPRFEWFDEKSGWINPITPQDRTRWMLWARGELARSARQSGIEQKAQDHARELIASAADGFGWKSEVSFERTAAANPPR